MNKAQYIFSVALFAILCQASATPLSPLTDELLQSNKGDYDGLWNAWIKPSASHPPELKPDWWEIELKDGEFGKEAEVVISKDLARFCSASGGNQTLEKTWDVRKYICISVTGKYVGEFDISGGGRNDMRMRFDSAQMQQARQEAQKNYATLQRSNGPTGVIVTTNGNKYRFIRVGTLQQRDVFGVRSKAGWFPLEEIADIKFDGRVGNIKITKIDGKAFEESIDALANRKEFTAISGYGYQGIPFVLVSSNGLTTQAAFNGSGQEIIQNIQIDDPQIWKGKTGAELTDSADYQSLASSTSAEELNRLILKYSNSDPEKLIPKAKIKLSELLAAQKKQHDIEAARQAKEQQQEAAMHAKELRQIASFRKGIGEGDETNCGPVIEAKGKLLKVSFAVANYGNEHWIRRDQIFPVGFACRFVNGEYQFPG